MFAVGRRVEDFAGLAETKPPGVVGRRAEKFQLRAIRLEAEKSLPEAMTLTANFALKSSVTNRGIDPVIQSQTQIARPRMGVVDVKTTEQHLAHISFAVAVCVLEEKNVWRLSDDQSAVDAHHAGRNAEFVSEKSELIGFASAGGVLGDDNAVVALTVGMLIVGVINTFGNEGAAASIPSNSDRFEDVRLSGEQLDTETTRHAQMFHRLGRR